MKNLIPFLMSGILLTVGSAHAQGRSPSGDGSIPSGRTDSTGQPVRVYRDGEDPSVDPAVRGQQPGQRPGTLSDDRSGFSTRNGDPRTPGSIGAATTQPPNASGSTSGSGTTASPNVTGQGSTSGNAGAPAGLGSAAGGGPGAISNAGTKGTSGSGH